MRLVDQSHVSDALIEQAAAWYRQPDSVIPVAFRHLHPAILRATERVCQGDWRRVVLSPDGQGLDILNSPKWHQTREVA